MNTSRRRKSLSDFLPTLAGIAYRRQTLAKLRLLTFSFLLLRRITCLLLRAGTGRATAGEYNNNRWNQNHGGCQFFHRKKKSTTISAAKHAASSGKLVRMTKQI